MPVLSADVEDAGTLGAACCAFANEDANAMSEAQATTLKGVAVVVMSINSQVGFSG
jgi:hypothetical protein